MFVIVFDSNNTLVWRRRAHTREQGQHIYQTLVDRFAPHGYTLTLVDSTPDSDPSNIVCVVSREYREKTLSRKRIVS